MIVPPCGLVLSASLGTPSRRKFPIRVLTQTLKSSVGMTAILFLGKSEKRTAKASGEEPRGYRE